MATIKQQAEAEALRAEADDDDTEPGDTEPGDTEPGDTEPDPDDDDADPAQAPPPSEAAMERAFGDIEQAGDSYVAHVKAIQHETPLGLVECPLCPVPGFVPETPMPEVDPLQRLAVLTVMGEGAGRPRTPHPNLHRCEACDGDGLMDTGSRREEFATSPCPKCGGNGYIDKQVEQAQADARLSIVPPPPFDQVPAPAPQNNAIPTPMVSQGGYPFALVLGAAPDQVGRLAGHPLWGQPIEAGGL